MRKWRGSLKESAVSNEYLRWARKVSNRRWQRRMRPTLGRKGDLMATTQAPAPHTGRTRAPYREAPSYGVPAPHEPPTSAPAPSSAVAQPDARPSGKSRRLLFLIPILLVVGAVALTFGYRYWFEST